MGRAAAYPFAALAALAALATFATFALRSPSPSPSSSAACGGSPGRPAAPPPEYEDESPLSISPAMATLDSSTAPPLPVVDGGAHLP
jgi:hypothetical protein